LYKDVLLEQRQVLGVIEEGGNDKRNGLAIAISLESQSATDGILFCSVLEITEAALLPPLISYEQSNQ